MKKWTIIVAILICCGLYAIVRFGLSGEQHAHRQAGDAQVVGPAEVNNSDRARVADVSRSEQPQRDSTSVSEITVEGITKAFTEFQSCIKDEKYETAWMTLANSMRSQYGDDFQKWKDGMSSGEGRTAFLNLHPESVAESSEGFVLSARSESQTWRLYFVKEDGRWKIYEGQVERGER